MIKQPGGRVYSNAGDVWRQEDKDMRVIRNWNDREEQRQ